MAPANESMVDLRELTSYADMRRYYSRDALWHMFDGDAASLNIAHECVDRHIARGEAVRVAHADGREEVVTFADLSARSSQIAHYLRAKGIQPGERVAIMLEPGLCFYASLFGVMKSGAIAVPLFTLFGPHGLRLRLDDCNPSLLIVAEEKLEVARDAGGTPVETEGEVLHASKDFASQFDWSTSADDLALFQYTSGTTRELPEAVKHKHKSVVTVAVAALYATGVRPSDRFMCPSSPAWGHGLAHGTLGPLGMGARISTYAGEFRPERLLEAIKAHEITNLSAAATHYRMMRASPQAEHYHFELEKASFTGEALDSPTAAWAKSTFGTPICSIYGTTEVGVILAQYPGAQDLTVKPGSLGRPMPGLDIQVLDEQGNTCQANKIGELKVRRRSGWFATKDFAHTDDEGDFFHDGRADDVIISAGWTISAREVEEALMAHEGVAEAAVIGVPDSVRGQIIKAFVVNRDNDSVESAQTLQTFVKQTLAAHSYPRAIEFVSSLPKTPAGKINRRVLREQENKGLPHDQ